MKKKNLQVANSSQRKNLYTIKHYIIGFVLGLFFVGSFSYASSSGGIGSLFLLKSASEINGDSVSNYRLDGANILDSTVGTEELEDNIGLTNLMVQSVSGLFGTGVIFNSDLVLTNPPSSPLHAVTMSYVDGLFSSVLTELGNLGTSVLNNQTLIQGTKTDIMTKLDALEAKIDAMGAGAGAGMLGVYKDDGVTRIGTFLRYMIDDTSGNSLQTPIEYLTNSGTRGVITDIHFLSIGTLNQDDYAFYKNSSCTGDKYYKRVEGSRYLYDYEEDPNKVYIIGDHIIGACVGGGFTSLWYLDSSGACLSRGSVWDCDNYKKLSENTFGGPVEKICGKGSCIIK
ncbi:hypothetical protein CSB07_00685 [Candidatus Gracilibacteria bacterium]|nr:MAG: hypothetical protein CSB07_00685 [Candidatus Gracilibacteria bacterium]